MQMDGTLARTILDGLREEIVFVGPDHVIRYMNRFAVEKYAKYGGKTLVGRSIFDCHNERSREIIYQAWARFQAGEDEVLISQSEKKRTYMRAVRDAEGNLLGYYEQDTLPA